MPTPVNKIIRASAGSGKTYRLSLEYIALLLKYHQVGLKFSEILVITFTRKATAEIRERIFGHIEALAVHSPLGEELQKNLAEFFGLVLNDDDEAFLRRLHHDMLLNKHLVQISTIDAFTNSIFKTIVAPFLGISDYEIREELDDNIRDELYRSVLEDQGRLNTFRGFFMRSRLKKIESFERFFMSIINKRWAFYLIEQSRIQRSFADKSVEEIGAAFRQARTAFDELFSEAQQHALAKGEGKSPSDFIPKGLQDVLETLQPQFGLNDVHRLMLEILDDPILLEKHYDLLIDDKNLWFYHRIFSKNGEKENKELFIDRQKQAQGLLADYFFFSKLMNEEKDLFEIIRHTLTRYDELKMRDKSFTYNDISYYTYRFLYDPALSLIEDDSVVNSFYEHLSTAIRFILIDEFQDTSIVQYKIMLPIIREVISGFGVKEYGGAIIVGDEKQAIYGWRGGERDLLLNLPEILPGAEEITLDQSFRSDENIVIFHNQLFGDPVLHQQLQQAGLIWPYTPIQAHKKNNSGCIQFYLRNFAVGKNLTNTISSEKEAVQEFLNSIFNQLSAQQLSIHRTAIIARTNNELMTIASVLNEMEISYVIESADSILDHRAVKPLYLLLNFLLYRDFFDLLKCLRSDIALIDAVSLKELLLHHRDAENQWDLMALLQSFSHIPAIKKILTLIEEWAQFSDLASLALRAIELFNFTALFPSDNDLKNIHQFLLLMIEFQQNNTKYPSSLPGFITYCREERDQDAFRQASLEDVKAITLMTIHKSKGLEFDNVLLYWNVSHTHRSANNELNAFIIHDKAFRHVQSYLLTFNYQDLVPLSSFKEFTELAEMRELLEELNNIYVALTRAKSNLFICYSYDRVDGFEALKEKTTLNIPVLIAERIQYQFVHQGAWHEYDKNRQAGEIGQLLRTAENPRPADEDKSIFSAHNIDQDFRKYLTSPTEPFSQHLNWKTAFLEQNSIQVGNAAHYYLSFIRHGGQDEKKTARRKTIAFYGTLIEESTLSLLIEKLERFVDSHPDIFSMAWTQVFTEFTIFDADGAEIRLDRIMVDQKNKHIEIIDYKTGHLFEPQQIEEYVSAMKALPTVLQHQYQVTGRFVEID